MPERSIGTPREPITRSGGTLASVGRTLPASSMGITRSTSGRRLATAEEAAVYAGQTPPPQSAIDAINNYIRENASKYLVSPFYGASNQATTVSPSVPSGTFYGTDNPYLVLSDVFRNIFGNSGDVGRQRDVGQALVPVTSTSGGTSPFLLILIVAGIAGVVYYFYKKRQSQ